MPICGRADDVVDGADVAALLVVLLLLTGAEEAAPLAGVGRGAVDVAEDGEGFAADEVGGAVELAAVVELEVSTLGGADDVGAVLVEGADVEVEVGADPDADVGALFVSFFGCSILILAFSSVEAASVVTVDDVVAVVPAEDAAPLASSSAPK